VSPEGRSFVYVRREGGNGDIYLQRIGGTNAIDLTADSPKDDSEPAFSPDGAQIVFRSERAGGGLFLMGATGESVKRLTDVGHDPAWTPDGREVVFSTESFGALWPYGRNGIGVLWALNLASGEKRRLTPEDVDAVQPSCSPHGTRVAFWGLRAGGQRDLFTVSRTGDAKSVVTLTDDPDLDWNPVWSPDGRFVYFSSDRGGTLGVWRIPVDEASGRASGPPQPVPVPFPAAGYLSFTRDGHTLLLAGSFGTDSIERVGFDAQRALAVGDPEPVFATSLRIFYLAASADGSELALSSGGRREDVYTLRADGSGLRQLTNDAFKDRGPVFLPDGKGLLFYSTRSGRYGVWSLQLDGSGARSVAQWAEDEFSNPAVSSDASQLAVTLGSGTGTAVARMRGADPVSPERVPAGPDGAVLEYASWSRDGKQLAGILKSRSGRRRPAIYTLDSKRYRTFDVDGAEPIVWVDEDRTLLFWTPNEIEALDVASGRVLHAVLEPASHGRAAAYTFALSGDERSLFLVNWRDHADVWQVSLP
jgi:Tol biopolymer transport system component